MTDREPDQLEQAIQQLTASLVEKLDALATSNFVRDGVVKEMFTSLIWDVFYRMPDQRYALQEALENFPDLIREAIAEENEKTEG